MDARKHKGLEKFGPPKRNTIHYLCLYCSCVYMSCKLFRFSILVSGSLPCSFIVQGKRLHVAYIWTNLYGPALKCRVSSNMLFWYKESVATMSLHECTI
jgi:hypothetical protein